MTDVVHLTPAQINQASLLLCQAFYDDPLVAYIVPTEARRDRVLPAFYRLVVRYALRYGEVFTTEGVEGIACWLAPGNTRLSTWRLLRVAPGAPFLFSVAEQQRNTIFSRYAEDAHERAVSGLHWYLWCLGVEPSHQHQGLGGQLIQPMLAHADRNGYPCYLETTREVNVPFYKKHGFTIVSDGLVPGTALRVWGMRRG